MERELVGYVEEAKDANLVEIGIYKDMRYVQLVNTGAQWCPRSEYVPFVETRQHFLDDDEERPTCGDVAAMIYNTHPGLVQGDYKKYVLGAEAAGVVVRRRKDRIQLATC